MRALNASIKSVPAGEATRTAAGGPVKPKAKGGVCELALTNEVVVARSQSSSSTPPCRRRLEATSDGSEVDESTVDVSVRGGVRSHCSTFYWEQFNPDGYCRKTLIVQIL